jgi:hypothetical protein
VSWITQTDFKASGPNVPDTLEIIGATFNGGTSGGPLLIFMNLQVMMDTNISCQPMVDGMWAGAYAGRSDGEGTLAAPSQSFVHSMRWAKSALYPGITGGSHRFSIQCTAGPRRSAIVGGPSSWGVVELSPLP